MRFLVFVLSLFITQISLCQGPINVPETKTKIVEFVRDSTDQSLYTATIGSSDEYDYYISFDIIDSLKESDRLTLLAFAENKVLVFKFVGTFNRGKYIKYYSSGELLAKGRIKEGKHFKRYTEYDQNGALLLKCTYINNRIAIGGKAFYRRSNKDVLCGKKWFKKVDYNQCQFFTNTPKFFRLLLPTDSK